MAELSKTSVFFRMRRSARTRRSRAVSSAGGCPSGEAGGGRPAAGAAGSHADVPSDGTSTGSGGGSTSATGAGSPLAAGATASRRKNSRISSGSNRMRRGPAWGAGRRVRQNAKASAGGKDGPFQHSTHQLFRRKASASKWTEEKKLTSTGTSAAQAAQRKSDGSKA